jgi:hypothetical protein
MFVLLVLCLFFVLYVYFLFCLFFVIVLYVLFYCFFLCVVFVFFALVYWTLPPGGNPIALTRNKSKSNSNSKSKYIYGCEALSLVLEKEHCAWVYGDKVMTAVFVQDSVDVTGGCWKSHSEELLMNHTQINY